MNEQRNIVFVGAGGFAQEIYAYVKSDILAGRLRGVSMKGVLDDFPDQYYRDSGIALPYLGKLMEYNFSSGDYAIVAIGDPRERQRVCEALSVRGAAFFTYVHSSCYVADSAVIGVGAVVCPNSIVNAGAVLGDQVVINVFCSVGHGASVGDFSVLSPFAALNGNAKIGVSCFLGTRATVFPRVRIGNRCKVDSHSTAKADVEDGYIISCRSEYSVVKNRLI